MTELRLETQSYCLPTSAEGFKELPAAVGQAGDAGRAEGAVLGSWRDSQQAFFFCRINRSNVTPWNPQSEVSSAVPSSRVEGELLLHLRFPNHCLPWHHQSRELPST